MKTLNLLFTTLLLLVFMSCNQQNKKENTKKVITPKQETTYNPLEKILDNANNLTKKEVNVTGIVDHVCKHGGNRFKLLSSDGKEEIKVELGDNFKMVSPNIAGKMVKVTGILIPIQMDAEMIKAWEKKTRKNHIGEENTKHFKEEIAIIQTIYKQIESGEIPYYTTYSIEASSYEEE